MGSGSIKGCSIAVLDVLVYALFLTVGTFVSGLLVSVGTGGGLTRTKHLLFVTGFLTMAYSTIKLWPRSPEEMRQTVEKNNSGKVISDASEQSALFRWMPASPKEKEYSKTTKIFVTSILLFGTSFVMEFVFGIG